MWLLDTNAPRHNAYGSTMSEIRLLKYLCDYLNKGSYIRSENVFCTEWGLLTLISITYTVRTYVRNPYEQKKSLQEAGHAVFVICPPDGPIAPWEGLRVSVWPESNTTHYLSLRMKRVSKTLPKASVRFTTQQYICLVHYVSLQVCSPSCVMRGITPDCGGSCVASGGSVL